MLFEDKQEMSLETVQTAARSAQKGGKNRERKTQIMRSSEQKGYQLARVHRLLQPLAELGA